MTEIPSKNDPSADWPEEIKQAYEHLKIPSLYDAVLANEKLSLEIRRQDRELKNIVEGIQFLTTQFNSLIKIVEEEWEEYEEDGDSLEAPQNRFGESSRGELNDLEVQLIQENQFYSQNQSKAILMETYDDMRDLSRMVRQATQQLLALLPKKEGLIPHPPTWYPIVEGILQSIVEGIERSRYQLLARLEDMHIEMVDPKLGDAFNETLHHALEYVVGGKSGTIARVVRVGYRQGHEILRLAEVTIYS